MTDMTCTEQLLALLSPLEGRVITPELIAEVKALVRTLNWEDKTHA